MSPLIRAWKLDENQTLISRDTCMYTHVARNGARFPFGALVNQCIVWAFSSILRARGREPFEATRRNTGGNRVGFSKFKNTAIDKRDHVCVRCIVHASRKEMLSLLNLEG